MFADRIMQHLADAIFPRSVNELAQAFPEARAVDIERACYDLRERGRLGRNGADTHSSPYRFYVKRKGGKVTSDIPETDPT